MRRREFIAGLGGAAAWPLAARAQQPQRMRRLGVLVPSLENDPETEARIAALKQRMRELGWIEGHNLWIDISYAGGNAERYGGYVRQLIASAPDVILLNSNPALVALLRESRTIPTVFVQVADPVGSGFVDSLARPGGNTTGFTNFEPSMGGKWLGILKEASPDVARVAVLLHPETAANVAFLRSAEAAAPSAKITVVPAGIHDAAEIEGAIADSAREPNSGLIVLPHVVTASHRALIADLALRHRLPAVYPFRFMATSGGLISYGINVVDLYQQAAVYIDRILRGEKPADLPVQAPTKFELVINLKTAKALGLTMPATLVARADEVIE